MMKSNKYQRALDRLTISDYEHNNPSYVAHLANKADNELIQELVDKAIPIKPLIEQINMSDFDSLDSVDMFIDIQICPTCHHHVFYPRCCQNNDCRQAIDWKVE